MSYKKNLGQVKGETGTAYIPEIKTRKNSDNIDEQYITWSSSDDTSLPDELIDTVISSQIYIPQLNNDGTITWTLGKPTATVINNSESIKGSQGEPGQIVTVVTDSEPQNGEIGTIYIYDEQAYIFDDNGERYTIENMLKFSEYYTKNETYKKYDSNELDKQSMTYDCKIIDDMIGDAESAMIYINNILDRGNINIAPENTE